MEIQQGMAAPAWAGDRVEGLLAFVVTAVCAYAALTLLQRAHHGRLSHWHVLATFALGLGIATMHFIGVAGLPALADSGLAGEHIVDALLAAAALAALAIYYASHARMQPSAHLLFAVLIGLGLALLAGSGVTAVDAAGGSAVTYALDRIIPALALAIVGSSVVLSSLHSLRVMPQRIILPPRAFASVFVAAALTAAQASVFHAAAITDIATPGSALPAWLPLSLCAAVLAAMAALIQIAQRPERRNAAARRGELGLPLPHSET